MERIVGLRTWPNSRIGPALKSNALSLFFLVFCVQMQIAGVVTAVNQMQIAGGLRSPEFHRRASGFIKSYPSFSSSKLGVRLDKLLGRGLTVRSSVDSSDSLVPIAPLQFQSPVGQLLDRLLQTHPHLFQAAIDQQLENLQNQRDAPTDEAGPSPQDLLYKRIAEVKEKEARKTFEEIIYCSIIHKFIDRGISMIPKIPATSDPTGRVDFWPNQEQKLVSVHSSEAFEMIQSHLSLVLGERLVGALDSTAQISKIKLGKLYAASIMYGYFLKRVEERFQLERTMKILPEGFTKSQASTKDPEPANETRDPDSLFKDPADYYEDDSDAGELKDDSDDGSYRLRSYVMYLDADTLQRYATIRSKEAISLIEKQTQALFGSPDIRISSDGSFDTSNDEVISITFSGLTMLVLEAITFGSFLWDAESYAETKCHFLKS